MFLQLSGGLSEDVAVSLPLSDTSALAWRDERIGEGGVCVGVCVCVCVCVGGWRERNVWRIYTVKDAAAEHD